jgi:hypothetical protein
MSLINFTRIWWARLLGREAVVLQDWEGSVYHSQARRQAGSDELRSWVYTLGRIGPIILNQDGTVSKPNGDVHFIERWVYLDRKLRFEQIIRGCEWFEF